MLAKERFAAGESTGQAYVVLPWPLFAREPQCLLPAIALAPPQIALFFASQIGAVSDGTEHDHQHHYQSVSQQLPGVHR